MPSRSGYSCLLATEVYLFGETLRLAERRALGDTFNFLADHPFFGGDYQEIGPGGQTVEMLVRGKFLFVYWSDHAVKEVRILRVDRA